MCRSHKVLYNIFNISSMTNQPVFYISLITCINQALRIMEAGQLNEILIIGD